MKIASIDYLYHGSDKEFEFFDFNYVNAFKDFGIGFYLTSSFSQAQRWAQNKAKRKSKAYIYCYSLCSVPDSSFKVLELLKYDKEWLDFITKNRIEGIETDYDIIYDRMADNQFNGISETLTKYHRGEIKEKQAIDKIKWKYGGRDQYCFKNKRALSLLKRQSVVVQYKDDKGIWKQERE